MNNKIRMGRYPVMLSAAMLFAIAVMPGAVSPGIVGAAANSLQLPESQLGILIGLYFAADIFAMMGSTTEVISLGLQYTNVIYSGSVVFISVVALNSLLHAEGDTKTFRNVLILSFILNIFLNPLFIFGYGFIPPMGMTGIGVATIISQIIAFLILLAKIMIGSGLAQMSRCFKSISSSSFATHILILARVLSWEIQSARITYQ